MQLMCHSVRGSTYWQARNAGRAAVRRFGSISLPDHLTAVLLFAFQGLTGPLSGQHQLWAISCTSPWMYVPQVMISFMRTLHGWCPPAWLCMSLRFCLSFLTTSPCLQYGSNPSRPKHVHVGTRMRVSLPHVRPRHQVGLQKTGGDIHLTKTSDVFKVNKQNWASCLDNIFSAMERHF